jgi:diguanylate cyclase (GGDEF)-like protein
MRGEVGGIAIPAAAVSIWLTVPLTAGNTFTHWLLPVWNGLVRFGIFIIVAYLGARRAQALKREARLARIDTLTGIMNRRALFEAATRFLELAQSHGHHTTVIYIDVDDFKQVNDRVGHHVGDQLLTTIAAALRQGIRTSDLVSRRGGDEFVLLLPETGYEGAQACVASIKNRLSRIRAKHGWPITFSMGVATFLKPPASIEETIKVADELLYRAKMGGKNEVVHEILHVARSVTLKTAGSNGARGRRTGEKLSMRIYDFSFTLNPHKLRIYLPEKGLSIPLQRIDLRKGDNLKPAFLAKNPMGALPVLELDDGSCLTESLAIIEYLEELHPDPPMIGT